MVSSSNRHVCHVFPSPSWGGAEIYAVKLAVWQKERGDHVSVWALKGSRMAREARERGLDVIESNLPWRKPFVALTEIASTIRERGITHLHHHWAGGAWTFLGVRWLVRVRQVIHMHLWISRSKRDLLHRFLYLGFDALVVAGDRAASAAREFLPFPSEKVRIVPYAMDLEKFAALPPSPFELPTQGRMIGMFARLDEQKGTMELLKAAETFLKALPDVTLLLMGDPNVDDVGPEGYSARLKAAHQTHPFRDRIKFLPFHRDYLAVMKKCSLVVAPSYHESYSLVFLDAFAMGIPVLTTDIGGSPDLVPAARGWLVPPREVESLAKGVIEAMRDPSELQRRGKAAHDYVFRSHSPESVLTRLALIYT